ncbi:MAG: TraR/DksA family transcriptional regulator [Phycisphaerales bacterium]|nr:TraR/DksA family transcriptional regulator [Phycisphaerales bacterium]
MTPPKGTKKTAKKKAATKKKATAKKSAAKKPAKKTVKKSAKKTPAKKTAKKAAKKTTKKAAKKTAKKTSKKPAASKSADKAKADEAAKGTTTSRRRRQQTVAQAVVSAEVGKDGYVIVNGRRIRRIAVDVSATSKKRSAKTSAATSKATTKKVHKSRLQKKDLDEFRTLLLAKRREVLQALDSMEHEALRSDSGETSNMPIHMADVGSDAYEQDLKLGISASERERIRDIDAALERISNGTYGVCESSGKAIRKARLRAKPWARYGIEAARKNERRPRRGA